ncbi:hypothetical protein ABZP36_018165, partial [Zizania latifolia]
MAIAVPLPPSIDHNKTAAVLLKGMTAHVLLRRVFQQSMGQSDSGITNSSHQFFYSNKLLISNWWTQSLRTLFLEECTIADKGTEWLHDLIVKNHILVALNFHMTDLTVMPADLELLAKK